MAVVVGRVGLVSALLASVIGLMWLAILVHLMRLLSEAANLLGTNTLLLAPPMGWTMFWLYCTVMAIANVSVAVGAYLHLRGMQVIGRSLLWISTALLMVGVAFYDVAPDQFIPYFALSNFHDSLTLIGVPAAFLAGIAAVAAITPPTLQTRSRPRSSGERGHPTPEVLRPNQP